MDNSNRKRTTPMIVMFLLVALVAYGLGAGTMFVAGQPGAAKLPVAAQSTSEPDGSERGNTAQATPGLGGGVSAQATPVLPTGAQWGSFLDTYNAVNDEFYYRPLDKQAEVYGAAKGLIQSLGDDYTSFQTPQEAQGEQSIMQGNFEGVGIYIGQRNDLPTVIAPISNTPAERAGIRARDIIVGVDGRDVTKFTIDRIANIVRGPAGTKVTLTIVRGNAPAFDVTLTRARIEVPSVTFKMVDGVAHIEVSIFNDKTTPELDAALQKALDQNAQGIVLDLRNNGGGYVVAALEMLGRFLPAGSVAFYESHKSDHSDDRPQMVIANAPSSLDVEAIRKIPLAVLINGGSASASELTSGALQDYGRATLIGEQSFGKGSEQHVRQWPDGSSAHITFAHWLTPLKKRDVNPQPTPVLSVGGTPPPLPTFTPTPQQTLAPAQVTATAESRPLYPVQTDRGLTPDIVVVRTEKDYLTDKDPQLNRAVEFIKTNK